jgi:nucleotide-binding universal stress UspA family protein
MSEPRENGPGAEPAAPAPQQAPRPKQRVFLVVVDDTQEMRNALRFACRRAQHTRGRVALLYVIEPVEFQHWLGVGRMMEDEARTAAEQKLQAVAAEVFAMTGSMPILHMREGSRRDELMALIAEEESISLLVLGTATGNSNPGPLVTYLIGHMGGRLRVPVTLVPGHLTPEEIDQVT